MNAHTSRRTRAAGATVAWLATAAAATVAASVAVGAIGSGILPSAEPPLRPDEVDRRLAAAPAPATSTAPARTAPVSTGRPAPTVLSSPGGIVLARCEPDPFIVTTAPGQGYGVKDIEPEDGGQRVRFESGRNRVEVLVTCTGGVPSATIRTR
ncbi:hypothetical protein [Actinophytocola sp.]|uniref:hypothetical protein n=1 Tax=Actinophytocola sp. TaxID=1872138 RepID=UPI002D7F2038|nr:hypothetical protein [Actinophytocola sp.]HET9139799.1 hypothetical protein [Actinophytocola sp.]